jgi:hydroxyethylthiazole kinase-like uncharacterized protein yjeF
MRRADRHAIEALGFPARLLMENAGRAVATAILRQFPQIRRPLVLCGSGNNGGDGFVVARTLRERDERVRPVVRVFGDRARMSEESGVNLELLLRTGAEVAFADEKGDLAFLVAHADAVIDAVFGVGLERAVTGELAELFDAVSELAAPVIAGPRFVRISSSLSDSRSSGSRFVLWRARSWWLTSAYPPRASWRPESVSTSSRGRQWVCFCPRGLWRATKGPSATSWSLRARPGRPERHAYRPKAPCGAARGWSRLR